MHDWKADLDQCSRCGSARLVRRLGEVECRDCGFVVAPAGGVAGAGVGRDAVVPGLSGTEVPGLSGTEVPGLSGTEVPGLSGSEAPGLSEEVARALERVLGRGPVRK
jgi:hypothetical protein